MIRYRAAWVLPIARAADPRRLGRGRSRPHRGARAIGRARACRRTATPRSRSRRRRGPARPRQRAHASRAVVPARRGPAGVRRSSTWIRGVMARGAGSADPDGAADPRRRSSGRSTRRSACGTALVGDISNTLVTFDAARRAARSPAVVFYELIRLQRRRSRRRSSTHARRRDRRARRRPIACASAWPRTRRTRWRRCVLRAIRRGDRSRSVRAVQRASGGVGRGGRVHPHRRRAVAGAARGARRLGSGVGGARRAARSQYLDDSGFLDARVLAVHGVQMTPADLARLAARGATLVTCPRSNGHTGAGAPPIEDFYASGVRVAVGTDSLASAPDLNVFAELADDARAGAGGAGGGAARQRDAPRARARSASTPTTARSSRASGRGCSRSTIPARRRRCGRIPGVSGIQPDQIRWIETDADCDCRLHDCRSAIRRIAICNRNAER